MKKLVEESLQEFLGEAEVFKDQVETGITPEDVDEKEFLVGLQVEKKHSENLAVQKELVLQNLAKNPKYYSEGMKKGMVDDPAAINLYKKYFIDKEEVNKEEVKESLNESLKDELIIILLDTVYKHEDLKKLPEIKKYLEGLSEDDLDQQVADYHLYNPENK
jgi:hypothetical protein